jgi:hypothetical protein
VGQRSADHSGADERDLLASHIRLFSSAFLSGAEDRSPGLAAL